MHCDLEHPARQYFQVGSVCYLLAGLISLADARWCLDAWIFRENSIVKQQRDLQQFGEHLVLVPALHFFLDHSEVAVARYCRSRIFDT